MLLNGEATKSKIELYYSNPMEISLEGKRKPFGKIDITELLGEDLTDFCGDRVLGLKITTPTTESRYAYSTKELANKIEHIFNHLMDVVIVNEKQKQATKDLFVNELWDLFGREAQSLEMAINNAD